MNEMRCSDIDELLAGYAANALDDDEGRIVAVHLAECRNHDAELAAIRSDFEAVAVSVGPVDPPAGLRSSLLDAFDREVSGSRTPAAPDPAPMRRPSLEPSRLPHRGLFARAGFAYALAAALLVIAVGLGAWGLSRGGDDGVVVATTEEAGNTLQITYVRDQHVAILDFQLAALSEDQTYQAWQIVDGAPVSVGLLNSNTGQIAFAADLDNASAVALSVEPAGGSEAPTSTPILLTELPES